MLVWFLGIGVMLEDLQALRTEWLGQLGSGRDCFSSLFWLCHPQGQSVPSGKCVSMCGAFLHSTLYSDMHIEQLQQKQRKEGGRKQFLVEMGHLPSQMGAVLPPLSLQWLSSKGDSKRCGR